MYTIQPDPTQMSGYIVRRDGRKIGDMTVSRSGYYDWSFFAGRHPSPSTLRRLTRLVGRGDWRGKDRRRTS